MLFKKLLWLHFLSFITHFNSCSVTSFSISQSHRLLPTISRLLKDKGSISFNRRSIITNIMSADSNFSPSELEIMSIHQPVASRNSPLQNNISEEIDPDQNKNVKSEKYILQVSALSNIIFLSAGVMYLTVSIWDLIIQATPAINDDITVNLPNSYNFISNLAPTTYLINSTFDVHLAKCILAKRKHERRERRGPCSMICSSRKESGDIMVDDWLEDPSETQRRKNGFYKIRKYAVHRRELSASLTFFIAALLSTFPVFLPWFGLDDDVLLGVYHMTSVHVYLLSSILAIIGDFQDWKSLDWNIRTNPDALETLGNTLFFVGSLVDVILFDYSFDDGNVGWPILSSSLWCIDALLYLNSDWLSLKYLRERNTDCNEVFQL